MSLNNGIGQKKQWYNSKSVETKKLYHTGTYIYILSVYLWPNVDLYFGHWHRGSWEPLKVQMVWKLIKTEGSTPLPACPLKSSLSWTWWVPRTPLSNHPGIDYRQPGRPADSDRQMQNREIKCLFTLPVNSTRVGSRVERNPLAAWPYEELSILCSLSPRAPLSLLDLRPSSPVGSELTPQPYSVGLVIGPGWTLQGD